MTDSLTVDGETHLITENRDEFGRSAGFAYSEADGAAGSEVYGYGTDGRLATAAFSHNGGSKQFGFSYLTGSNLLQTLTMPNNMTLTQQFETQRDLLTGMLYKRGETSVVERYYTYDSLGRPLTRQQNRNGGTRSDSFTHNDRSELTAGILGTKEYYYSYDNIGNRKTAKEDADEATNYDANELNQYTAVGSFVPEFDADGKAADGCKADWTHAERAPRRGEGAMGRARINQTRVQTGTGIWELTYNAENRPTVFLRTNEDGTQTRVSCVYDYKGRRATKKVETLSLPDAETGERTATTTLHQRYLYRGYLQIACRDLTRENHPSLWFITWDPTQSPRRPVGGLDNSGAVAPEGRGRNGVRPSQPVATRPLAIRKDGTWYCYGWDLTKNICEVFSNEGRINNTVIYSYTPYGAVTAEGPVTQPIQWSSEFYDDEQGLVYYNYRHYNPREGRWIGRDAQYSYDYLFCNNTTVINLDYLGLDSITVGKIPELNIELHVETNGAGKPSSLHLHHESFLSEDKYSYRNDKTPPGFYREDGKPLSNSLQKKLRKREDWKKIMKKGADAVNRNNGLAPKFGGGKILRGCVTLFATLQIVNSSNAYAEAIQQGDLKAMDRIFNETMENMPDLGTIVRGSILTDLLDYHNEMKAFASRKKDEKK